MCNLKKYIYWELTANVVGIQHSSCTRRQCIVQINFVRFCILIVYVYNFTNVSMLHYFYICQIVDIRRPYLKWYGSAGIDNIHSQYCYGYCYIPFNFFLFLTHLLKQKKCWRNRAISESLIKAIKNLVLLLFKCLELNGITVILVSVNNLVCFCYINETKKYLAVRKKNDRKK